MVSRSLVPRDTLLATAVVSAHLKWKPMHDDFIEALLDAKVAWGALSADEDAHAHVSDNTNALAIDDIVENVVGAKNTKLEDHIRGYVLRNGSKIYVEVGRELGVGTDELYDAIVQKFATSRRRCDNSLDEILDTTSRMHIYLDEAAYNIHKAVNKFHEASALLAASNRYDDQAQVDALQEIAGKILEKMALALGDNEQINEAARNAQGAPAVTRTTQIPGMEPVPKPTPTPPAQSQLQRSVWEPAFEGLVNKPVPGLDDLDMTLINAVGISRLYAIPYGQKNVKVLLDQAVERARDSKATRFNANLTQVAHMLNGIYTALHGYESLKKKRPSATDAKSKILWKAVQGALTLEYRTAWWYFKHLTGETADVGNLYTGDLQKYLDGSWVIEGAVARGLNVKLLDDWRTAVVKAYTEDVV